MGSNQNKFLVNGRIVDARTLTISHNMNSQKIEPRVLDVLLLLAKSQGELVTREQIFSEVWKDRIASDNSLNRNIATLRKILDEPESKESVIQTVPKKGYILRSPIEVQSSSTKRSHQLRLMLLIPIFGFAIYGLYRLFFFNDSLSVNAPKIAIQFEYLTDEFANKKDIQLISNKFIEKLMKLEPINISSLTVKTYQLEAPLNYDALNSDYLLRGILLPDDENATLSLYLIDLKHSIYLWNYSLTLEDITPGYFELPLIEAVKQIQSKLKLSNTESDSPINQISDVETINETRLHPKEKTRAFCLDGVDDFVEIPHRSEIDISDNDYSITTWIKTLTLDTRVIIDKRFEKFEGNVKGYSVHIHNGFIGTQLADGKGSWYCDGDPKNSSCTNYISRTFIADGQWHFLAITVDRDQPDGLKIYIDGQLTDTHNPTVRQGSLSNSKPLRIGSRSSSVSGLFKGSIGEVAIHNFSLSPEKIGILYNEGASRHCELPMKLQVISRK
ncbi:LamG-like jellyroll fold domain-containing protein [Pleionea sediminis]|uniref:LamG-like jellyroll fold domain-containing protein n=1 Tax=Pleionea sediminis TaxID=2569479 RepID=UPI0011858989|nr:LamG-like jellyroll fold domain-containing protein [Pleionea sediminis]